MALWDDIGNYLQELTLSEKAEKAVRRGDRQLKKKNFAAALIAYRDGLRIERDYAPLHLKAGIAAYFLGDNDEARKHLRRSLDLRPGLAEALFWMGLTWAAGAEWDRALSFYRRARRAGYEGINLALSMGRAYFASGDNLRARRSLERVLERLPGDRAALRLLARVLTAMGEHRALADVLAAESRGSGLPRDLLGALAVARCQTGRPDEGREIFEKMLVKAPDDGQVFTGLGMALAFEGLAEQAVGCLQRALSLSPRASLPAFHLAALLAAEEERITDALAVLASAGSHFSSDKGDSLPAPMCAPGEEDPEGVPIDFGVGSAATQWDCVGLRVFLLEWLGKIDEARQVFETLPSGLEAPWVWALDVLTGGDEPAKDQPESVSALYDYARGRRMLAAGGPEIPRAAAIFRGALARLDENYWAFIGPVPVKVLAFCLRKSLFLTGENALESEIAKREDLKTPDERIDGRFASLSQEVLALLNRALVLTEADPMSRRVSSGLSRLRDDYDRPLLVTIMGEFNTGKSSFINAFIGEAVAPMGVVPTTATINYLKYGAKKSLRIVFRDGSVEERPIDELACFVDERKGDRDTLREIDVVEILYPLEVLKSVNIVDTPGLNAPVPEHEKTTRDFLERSDAVLWLFSATQAGKASERQVLDIVRAHSRKAIGVVNKIDKIDDDERRQVVDELRDSFAGYFTHIGAVSARQALKARLENDSGLLAESLFPGFEELLSEDIFSKSRQIKDSATLERFRALLEPLLQRCDEVEMAARARAVELEKMGERVSMRRKEFSMTASDDIRVRINKELPERARRIARDLVDLLRAEDGFWGTTLKLSKSDRAAFRTRIDEGLGELVEHTCKSGLGPALRDFENELSQEWETFLQPLAQGFFPAFRVFAGPWLSVSSGDLYRRLVTGCSQHIRGGLSGALLDRILEELAEDEPAAAERLLVKQVSRMAERALSTLDRVLDEWSLTFFGALDDMCHEMEAALKEADIKRDVEFWKPIKRLFEQSDDLLQRLREYSAESEGKSR